MAKLFLSYAHEDRALVQALAEAMARDGHEAWWDRSLATGAGAFRPQIHAALDDAALVLVLWTARSRVSRFVADEADVALSQGKLLSLQIDGARPALGFGAIQAVALGDWAGDADDDATLAPLRHEVAARLASGPQPLPARPASAVWRPAMALLVATAVGFGALQWVLAMPLTLIDGLQLAAGHAVWGLALAAPAALHVAMRCRRLGLARWRALARPFGQSLAIGGALALLFGALALAAGVDGELPPAQRARALVSTVLFMTLVATALIGTLRMLLGLRRQA